MTDSDPTIDEAEILEDQFKRALIQLVEHEHFSAISYQVVKAMFSLLALKLRRGVEADPQMRPVFLLHCQQLHDFLAAGSESTPPTFH